MAGIGGAQCQRLLNKVKHISIWRPKARVMISRQIDAVREAVLADMDDLSSRESEEIDDEESVDENPKKTLSVRRLNCLYRNLTHLIYVMLICKCLKNACENQLKHLTAYFNVLLIC